MRIMPWIVSISAFAATHGVTAAENATPPAAPATRPFVISKETTYVTGPVRKDGTIDYVAAINERLSAGITKENNAAIPMLEALTQIAQEQGPHYEKVRKQLGMTAAADAHVNFAQDGANLLDTTLSGPWTAAKSPEAAKLLDSLKRQLDLLVEASKRDHYYMPLVREHDDDPLVSVLLPHLNRLRQLSNALKSRALLCLGNEDMKGFRRDAIAIVRLGRLNTHAPTLIENLVGTGVEAIGLDVIKIAASGGWLSEKDANDLLSDLRAAPPRRMMYETFEGAERGFMLEFLQTAAVHGLGQAQKMLDAAGPGQKPTLFTASAVNKDWNAAMRKANAWYDRLADAGKKSSFSERIKASLEVTRDVGALKSRYDGWKSVFAPIEDILVTMALPAMQRAYTTEARIAANEELTQTALALLAFKAKLGEYPPKLGLLAPAYFKSEPIDPFTDKPLIYTVQSDAYELKSAGPAAPGQGRTDDLIIHAGN